MSREPLHAKPRPRPGNLRFRSPRGRRGGSRFTEESRLEHLTLGHLSSWTSSLRSAVGLMPDSKFPMFLAWVPSSPSSKQRLRSGAGGQASRRARAPVPGDRGRICDDIFPLINRAVTGEPSWLEDLPLLIDRHGYPEETWFTLSYSLYRDDSGQVVGLFCACTETKEKVLAARRNAAERQSAATPSTLTRFSPTKSE